MLPHLTRMVLPLLCVTLLLDPRPANGQAVDESFRSDLETLFKVTGAAQMGSQVASFISGQLLANLKKSQPEIPDRALELAREVLDAEFVKAFAGPESLTELMVLIYARHFTQEDIRGLLAFYSTDLGRKTIQLMPVVFREGTAAGQQWAEQQMPRISKILEARLQAEGFIK